MFGAFAFGTGSLGASPSVWRSISDSSGALGGAVLVEGQSSAVASGSAAAPNSIGVDGRVAAMFLCAGAMSTSESLAPGIVAAWNTSGTSRQAAQLAGSSGAAASSAGIMTGSSSFTGYRMRVYDQAFPANPSSGSSVQVGARFFEWRATSARWHPLGPTP